MSCRNVCMDLIVKKTVCSFHSKFVDNGQSLNDKDSSSYHNLQGILDHHTTYTVRSRPHALGSGHWAGGIFNSGNDPLDEHQTLYTPPQFHFNTQTGQRGGSPGSSCSPSTPFVTPVMPSGLPSPCNQTKLRLSISLCRIINTSREREGERERGR